MSVHVLRVPRRPELRAVYRQSSEPGYGTSYDTSALPDRVFSGLDEAQRPPSTLLGTPEIDAEIVETPLSLLLRQAPPIDSWPKEAARSLDRLEALWLLLEDRHRLLDSVDVEPLAHQVSLIEHVVTAQDLRHVLIADEVGLGKTVEAGQIIRRLEERAAQPLAVLYLTQARLVENVQDEFRRMNIDAQVFGQTVTLGGTQRTSLFLASIHKAVHGRWFDEVVASGPWDVLIVDEAHHLKDYGKGPLSQMKLVQRLRNERLKPTGRLILLSGTPHQGHEGAFRNLLRLLSDDGKDEKQARGRVIYRIKDDIRDWDNNPLFPPREVRPPTAITVSEEYQKWMEEIRTLLAPRPNSIASSWRQAQALQWCASSPEAGLAYLVRLALRKGVTGASSQVLREAIAALRPFRGGSATEDVGALESRMREGLEADEDGDTGWEELEGTLRKGTSLVRGDAFAQKLERVLAWLREASDEKFVIFAQPLETVHLLARRLARETGVSIILGGQSNDERRREITCFRQDPAVRVLVSSRSGGEGINLQVARRLIHFDVPWNPMEMEQRVGRVHRFGSPLTVLVDTLVLAGSREQRILDRCRARLGSIVKQMVGAVDEATFARYFSRTMAQLPTEELEDLMTREGFGSLSDADADRLDHLVDAGFRAWQRLDEELRKSRSLQPAERGTVNEGDLAAFLTRSLGVTAAQGWRRRSLEKAQGGECRMVEKSAQVYRLPDGSLGYLGSLGGIGLVGPSGAAATQPQRLGLNHRLIAAALRERIGVEGKGSPRGAGFLHIAADGWEALLTKHQAPACLKSGALVTAYCIRDLELGIHVREHSARFAVFLSSSNGEESTRLDGDGAAALLRLLRSAKPAHARTVPWDLERQHRAEDSQVSTLKAERAVNTLRVAVFPIAALWVIPGEAGGPTEQSEDKGDAPTSSEEQPVEDVAMQGPGELPGPPGEPMLKALSIRPPYAELIMRGEKDVENRMWSTRHRGPLLIHAARTIEYEALSRYGLTERDVTTGALIGIVEMTDCTEEVSSRWHEDGCYGFYLKRPRRLDPVIALSGQRGIFDVAASRLGKQIRAVVE